MLKQLTVWLLTFAVLSANCSRLFVYAGFELNQKYIAAKLCENRNRPWMHCNGHCYLMKKIRQAEKNAQNQPVKDRLSHLDVSLVAEPPQGAHILKTRVLAAAVLPVMPDARAQGRFYSRIFQPPRVS
ncbi:MAG: hypothetical protein JST19_16360 [Bacteroidetes bacterium]|nr:hypothetical protein [Bacteroidota bacterium]